MSSTYSDVENQILNALAAIKERDEYTIAAIAREFGVSGTRLRKRWKGRPSKIGRRGGGKKLNEEQELA
ncbi:MAG: hypothetical protein M1823_005603, partial [Watsoniomyces obsoletus]